MLLPAQQAKKPQRPTVTLLPLSASQKQNATSYLLRLFGRGTKTNAEPIVTGG